MNEGQSKELVGRPAIYRDEYPGACFTNTLIRFRVTDAVLPEYALLVFLHYLKSGAFQSIARITTNIAHLGAGRFAEVSFPIPSIKEQQEIIDRVALHGSLYNRAKEDLYDRMKQTQGLRAAVLKSAFSGALVPQDPKDESASALLARIASQRAAALSNVSTVKEKKSRRKFGSGMTTNKSTTRKAPAIREGNAKK